MEDFYRRWLAGAPTAEALQQAQLGLLHNPSYSDPFFWAAFNLTGDPQGRWKAPVPGPAPAPKPTEAAMGSVEGGPSTRRLAHRTWLEGAGVTVLEALRCGLSILAFLAVPPSLDLL